MEHQSQNYGWQPILTLILLLAAAEAVSQQLELKGKVSVHNSRYETGSIQYVQEAYITAPYATPDNTDEEGSFTLVFVGMAPGTMVRVQAEKVGLEVANAHDLERVVIGRMDSLPIYLAERGVLAQVQTELYNISKKALYAQRNKLIAQLRSEGEQREAAMEELKERLGHEIANRFEAEDLLNRRIAALEKRLPSFAQKLASQNLDFSSDLYISAYEHYREGDISGAVALLDSIALENSYRDAMRVKRQEETLSKAVKDLRQRRLSLLRQAIDSYALKAKGLELLFHYGEAAWQYERVIGIYKENGLDSLQLAEWYDKLGWVCIESGKYPKALDAVQEALSLRKDILDPKHPDLALSYNNISGVYYSFGEYQKALKYNQTAIAIQEGSPDPSLDLAISYNNISGVYYSLGEYQQALKYCQRAIAIQGEVLGPKHPDLAISHNNVALMYRSKGEYQRALEYHRKALAIMEEALGPKHPDLAIIYDNLALTHRSLGEYQQALKYCQRAITIQGEALDSKHPDLAISYNNVALVHRSLGEYQRALEYHWRALSITEEILDPKHLGLAASYNGIGNTYRAMEVYDKAMAYLERGLAIREEVLPPDHPDLATSYHDMGRCLYGMSQYKAALRHLQSALDVRQEVLPKNHPDLAASYDHLGLTYAKNGQWEEAKDVFEKYEKLCPNKGKPHRNRALYHALRSENEKALLSLQKAVELGYDDLGWIEGEEAFEGLREKKAYRELIRKLRLKS